MSEPIVEPGVRVVVVDHLALLAALEMLVLPDGVHGTLATTYAWRSVSRKRWYRPARPKAHSSES